MEYERIEADSSELKDTGTEKRKYREKAHILAHLRPDQLRTV